MKKIQPMESLPVSYPVGKISPRYEGMSDEIVLRKYLDGDERAFTELFERYQPRVIQGLRRRVSEAIAEEISQEAFLRVFRYARRFDFSRSFSGWLFVITINLLKNHFRYVSNREGRNDEERKRRLSQIPRPQEFLDPLSQCIVNEIEDLKLQAVSKLSFEQACSFLLFENTQMEYSDIAEAMTTELGTVKSRLNRARNNVKRDIKFYLN